MIAVIFVFGSAAADRYVGLILSAFFFTCFLATWLWNESARNKKLKARRAQIEHRQLLQLHDKAVREAGPFYEVTGR